MKSLLLRRKISFFAILIFPFCCVFSQADFKKEVPDSTKNGTISQLEEVVVTGTRTPKKIKEVPIYTRVISSETIKNSGNRSFISILENEIPGLDFTSNAGVPNINMQGLGGNYVLVLIDGERIAGETRNNIDYAMINPDNIERIEIVKGTSSTLYGSNAMGGVINVITKKNKKRFESTLSAIGGNYGFENYNAMVGVKKKKYALQSNVFYKANGNYFLNDRSFEKRIYADRVEINPALRSTEVEGGHSYSGEQKVSYTGIAKLNLNAKVGYFKRERYNAGIEGSVMHNLYSNFTTLLNSDYRWKEGQNISFAYNFRDYRKYNYYHIIDRKDRDYLDKVQSFRAVSQNKIDVDNEITAGLEYLEQSLDTYMFAGNSSFNNSSKSAFVQHDYKLGKKMNLLSGLRLDKNSSYGEHLSPKIAFKADFLESWSVRTSYAGGFRSPSLKELFTNWDHLGMFQIVGNPELKPEKNSNIMATLTYHKPKFNLAFNFSYNNITNKIGLFQNSSFDTIQYRNFDKQKIYGGELNADLKIIPQLTLQFGYSYVNDGLRENGHKISTIRPHSANLKLDYFFKRENYFASCSLAGRYRSNMDVFSQDDNDEYYKIVYNSYSIWRFNALLRYKKYAEMNLSIDNIFGYKSAIHNFYTPTTPGRMYQIGVLFYVDSVL